MGLNVSALNGVTSSSPFLGLNVLRQVSLFSGPFQLLNHSPVCFRITDLTPRLKLFHAHPEFSQPPPGGWGGGRLALCWTRQVAEGGDHLACFGLVLCTLMVSAALTASPGTCSLVTVISLPVSPLHGQHSALCRADLLCTTCVGSIGVWGWLCCLLVSPGRRQEGVVWPQFQAVTC